MYLNLIDVAPSGDTVTLTAYINLPPLSMRYFSASIVYLLIYIFYVLYISEFLIVVPL
jgi:hypothetical protein